MASNGTEAPDVLVLLRACISSKTLPIPTKTDDATTNTDAVPLEEATHLLFNTHSAAEGAQHTALAATTPTRFISERAGAALDALSALFAWRHRDTGVGEYIAATQALSEERGRRGLGAVTNLVFAEKLDLVNWLAGEETDSDFIKSLDDNAATRREAQEAADALRGLGGDVVMDEAGALLDGRDRRREEEARMREIYAGERRMGDRNTVLRGIKPTVGHDAALVEPRLMID